MLVCICKLVCNTVSLAKGLPASKLRHLLSSIWKTRKRLAYCSRWVVKPTPEQAGCWRAVYSSNHIVASLALLLRYFICNIWPAGWPISSRSSTAKTTTSAVVSAAIASSTDIKRFHTGEQNGGVGFTTCAVASLLLSQADATQMFLLCVYNSYCSRSCALITTTLLSWAV